MLFRSQHFGLDAAINVRANHKELNSLWEKALSVVRELLRPDAGEQKIYFCGSCIASVCIQPMLMLRMRQNFGGGTGDGRP